MQESDRVRDRQLTHHIQQFTRFDQQPISSQDVNPDETESDVHPRDRMREFYLRMANPTVILIKNFLL